MIQRESERREGKRKSGVNKPDEGQNQVGKSIRVTRLKLRVRGGESKEQRAVEADRETKKMKGRLTLFRYRLAMNINYLGS